MCLKALFAVGDINNDGEIDINEFLNVMCPAATTVIARLLVLGAKLIFILLDYFILSTRIFVTVRTAKRIVIYIHKALHFRSVRGIIFFRLT